MLPFGMVEPGMKPLAPFLALGQMLEEQPARAAPVRPALHPQAHQRRDLFGLDEIALHGIGQRVAVERHDPRSEEHTSELQSLMRISYAVFCLKKKKQYTA